MRPIKDMTGKRCGEWLVLHRVLGHVPGQHILWACRCSCGTEAPVHGKSLRDGSSTGCKKCAGPKVSAWLLKNSTTRTHGRSGDQVHWAWKLMKSRCFNRKSKAYKDYGGRGITMCRRWAESFADFIADMGERPPGMTIERIDNNGNYEPGNCKWIPRGQQRSNTRHTHMIDFEGIVKPAWHWAQQVGITSNAFMYRLRKWGIKRAITTPPSEHGKKAGRASVRKRGRFAMVRAARARWKHTPKKTINPETFKP